MISAIDSCLSERCLPRLPASHKPVRLTYFTQALYTSHHAHRRRSCPAMTSAECNKQARREAGERERNFEFQCGMGSASMLLTGR